jgi:cytochrome c biogenesis protein CcdA
MGRSLSLGPLARLSGVVTTLEEPKGSSGRNTFVYGFLYNVIGIGCTGALLLALMLYALTLGSFWTALGAFIVFSGTMGFLMLVMTALVGLSHVAIVRRLKTSIPVIRKVSGAIMLIVGALTVAFVVQGNQLFTKIFFPFFS